MAKNLLWKDAENRQSNGTERDRKMILLVIGVIAYVGGWILARNIRHHWLEHPV